MFMKNGLLTLGIVILILSTICIATSWLEYTFGDIAVNCIEKIRHTNMFEEKKHINNTEVRFDRSTQISLIKDNHNPIKRSNATKLNQHEDKYISLNEKCVELIPEHNKINANKINIVFVSINRRIDELLDQSISTVDYYGTGSGLMAIEPFKSNRDKFNFFYVNETGWADLSLLNKDYNGIGVNSEIDRLSEYCNLSDVYPIAFIDHTIVSNADHGGRIRIGYFKTPRPNVVVHEFGHSFGLLRDERAKSKVTLRNVSTQHENCYYSSDVNCTIVEECFNSGKCREITVCFETNESLSDCKKNSMWSDLIGSGCGYKGTVDCPLEYVTVTEEKCEQEEDSYICYNSTNEILKDPQANNEVDCYLGCDSMNSYRSTFSNIMISSGNYFSFGPSNERTLCGRIQEITGSAGGVCKDLCGNDCIDYDPAPSPVTPLSELRSATASN
ncbi:MAG: hypothetical protein JEZ07_16615 [Phycisphaerae bacterium]|nr:hypothetical protein [Phycisphaerae bacterium]